MRHVMPHERPTRNELGPILEQRSTVPAIAWAVAVALIVIGGWLELREAEAAIQFVQAHQQAAATPAPAPPR